MQDLYCKITNYQLQKSKEIKINGKTTPCSWVEKYNIVRVAMFPKLIYNIQCNLYQNLSWFLCRNWQSDYKMHMEFQMIQNSQNNLEKEKTNTSWLQNLLQSNKQFENWSMSWELTYKNCPKGIQPCNSKIQTFIEEDTTK